MRVWPGVLLAFLLGASPAPARAEESSIRIDIIASGQNGRLVDTLTTEDFEILEDGAPRPVVSVEKVVARDDVPPTGAAPIASRTDENREAGQEGTRLFAVFLDDYHVTQGAAAVRARATLERFVASLSPRDLLVVVRPLDSLVNVRLSRDRQAALAVVAAFSGREGDYVPRNDFEKNYIASDPARIELVRSEIAASALNALAQHLGGLNARRKTLVVISEGFKPSVRRRGSQSPLMTVDTIVRSADRGGVAVYAVDPGSLAHDQKDAQDPDHDVLETLASQTNGAALLTADAAGRWPERVLNDSRAYYTVEFQAAHTQDVGTFHPVQVRARRNGLVIAARHGYWTASADERLAVRLREEAAMPKPPAEPPLHVSQLIRPWFGMARGPDGMLRVRFVWEPTPRVPGDRLRLSTPTRVDLVAIKDGAPVFQGTVRSSTSEESAGGLADTAVFNVAPGRMRVQMTVRDESSRPLDIDTRDVFVGPMAGSVALGTAEILRARSAKEYREIAANAAAAPVAAREFSRTDRLLVRVPAYAEGEDPTLTARLLGRTAVTLRDLRVGQGPTGGVYDIDLPLAGLANGEYRIEVTVAGPGGRATESLPFRVIP